MTIIEIIIAIIGIICQVIIAILALFGRKIRHWMYKPSISLVTCNEKPYVTIETAEDNTMSDSDSS